MSDRTPPHSLAAEEAVVGAMLLSREAIDAAVAVVSAGDFYRPALGRLFAVIADLHGRSQPADAVTVADTLDSDELDALGGLDGLLGLQMNTPATSNAADYAARIVSHAVRRRIIAAGAEIVSAGYDAVDGDAAIASAQAILARAVSTSATSELVHIADAVDSVLARWEAIEAGDVPRGQLTGITPLDTHLGGLRDGSLVVVGARTGIGKTSFGLATAYHIARGGRPVLVVSLEMSATEIAQRQLLALARATDPTRTTITEQEREKLYRTISARAFEMCETDLWIDESPDVTVHRIRAQAAAMKATRGDLGLVVVDYLQLVRPGDAETRTLEVAQITRGLKLLAREVGCPVIALSQLRRSDGTRGGDKQGPHLSDLRESGSIEQDADVVLLLHRPPQDRPQAAGGYTADELAEPESIDIRVAKNRAGPVGTIRATWYPQWALIAAATSSTAGTAPEQARSDDLVARLPYID